VRRSFMSENVKIDSDPNDERFADIALAVTRGTHMCTAQLVGPLAVHRSLDDGDWIRFESRLVYPAQLQWAVTHLRSGRIVCAMPTREAGINCARRLWQLPIQWTDERPTDVDMDAVYEVFALSFRESLGEDARTEAERQATRSGRG
jgi:hypothetical protein